MKHSPSWILTAALLFAAPGCIFVHVRGDLDEDFWDEEPWGDDDKSGFHELSAALETCLADPEYDLDLEANPWRTEAEWTVRFAAAGSDGAAAFHKAKEAVLARVAREGGKVTSEKDEGGHAWSCSFRLDDEPGEASVRLVENANEDEARPHQLEITWEESD